MDSICNQAASKKCNLMQLSSMHTPLPPLHATADEEQVFTAATLTLHLLFSL